MSILNYTTRNIVEYKSIFPTVASYLDHLLFTIGTGHYVDAQTGTLCTKQYDGRQQKQVFLHEYPAMSDKCWDALIQRCHEKEAGWHESYFSYYSKEEVAAMLEKSCAKYQPITLDESVFSEESLYKDLVQLKAARIDVMIRPYPLSEDYSNIFKITEASPSWLRNICINFCKAWVRFLSEEIDTNHVWVQNNSTTVRDYADMEYTVKHRDMLAKRVQELESYQ